MITTEELSAVIERQRMTEERKASGLERNLEFNDILLASHALDITGVRRCGKSTVLRQRSRRLSEPWLYVNFESPLLVGFTLQDTVRLDALIQQSGARHLFFDEIDQLKGWERYVRQKLDEEYQVSLSGSNASLLEGELSTKLTGRHISKELFPFDYGEYLVFTHQEACAESAEAYCHEGGFPLYLQTKEEVVLSELFDDIVYRDVIVHNGVREVAAIRQLIAWLTENIGCRFSAGKLLDPLQVSCTSTITQWCDWIEKAYLFFFVPICSDSEKARLINPRKVYCIDTGLEYAVSSRRIPNDGARFENMVYLALRRKYKAISYFDNHGECDFIVSDRHVVTHAVQACVAITGNNREREFKGLLMAMKQFALSTGLIVTLNQRDDFEIDGLRILLRPFYEFACSLP